MQIINALYSNRLLIIILTIGLTLRIFIAFFYTEFWYTSDSWSYINQAHMLLDGKYPTLFPNGFPIIISMLLFFTGSNVATGLLLILLNIILSLLIIYLVYKISLTLYKKENLALIAALIVGLYPNQINFVRFILSDIPCTFFLVLSLYLFQNSKYKLSAFAVGLASIIRSTFLPLGILFSLYLFRQKEFKKGKIYLSFTLIPVCALLLYGFIINGKISLGENAFYNLTITANNFDGDYVDPGTSINEYLSYLTKDPGKFIMDRFLSLWELWGPLASINKWEKASLHYRILAGLRFPLLIIALYGFFKIPVSDEKIFFAMGVLILTIIHFFYFSSSRHSLTVEPFLAILAAKGLMDIYGNLFKRNNNLLIRKR